MSEIGKWTAGASYGPVLTPTELYLLGHDVRLDIHPILKNEDNNFQLVFHINTGTTTGVRPGGDGQELDFTARTEPATLPRISELYIITMFSPWCTIVRNQSGVTCGDVLETLFRDYSEDVTQAEFAALPPRRQDAINRYRERSTNGWGVGGYYAQPATGPGRIRRSDWLTDRIVFDRLGPCIRCGACFLVTVSPVSIL